jgi:hypothetical protein
MALSIQRIPLRSVSSSSLLFFRHVLHSWGDPEAFSDDDARKLRRLFARWFGVCSKGYRVRIWKDAVVLSHPALLEVEYSVSVQADLVLYAVHRQGGIVPGAHAEMSYLGHVVDLAFGEPSGGWNAYKH